MAITNRERVGKALDIPTARAGCKVDTTRPLRILGPGRISTYP
jgi:hypothetical protein